MLVRQAAKDGRIPVKWDIKKHHRFFPWIGTQPPQDGKGGRATGWRNKRRASAGRQV